ncbi:hypothetical protein B296_00004609 [Ensete ventricosum]|uniref:Uncharacterized protein n=1 Tax=Ensete ventricosum TaxID=4639 RepID=A0A427AE72_ENSVE|nr:hypothetical protein B296_00004609 [Ensete ventricosum]
MWNRLARFPRVSDRYFELDLLGEGCHCQIALLGLLGVAPCSTDFGIDRELHCGSADDGINLFLHWALLVERRLAQLPYITVEVSSMDEIFNLVLQVITLVDVVAVITVEATITLSVSLLRSCFYWVGRSDEAFFLDLKEDIGLVGVEGIGGGLKMAGLGLSILLFKGPGVGLETTPRETIFYPRASQPPMLRQPHAGWPFRALRGSS